ncbi:MAG: YjjG family noncanonical pyrimidine nucleotidase [Bacteroidota bacterium]|jgi:putative hydrolase of the HAD superfamily|nr:YjjG family noncanonical pyrimidine nucleotidase [Bacteroidota bacterium]
MADEITEDHWLKDVDMWKYRAIFFDADDTLFDYGAAEREAFVRTAEAFGLGARLEEAHAVYRVHNGNVWRELERGEITQDELKVERFRRVLRAMEVDEGPAAAMSPYYLDRLSEQTQLLPGAEDAVRAAGERHLLVLVTNGLTTVQRRRFAASPITRHFQRILISEELGVAKPDPAIFYPALEEFSLRPEDVLLVGDSTSSDMPAARNAGMDFCWINPGRDPVPAGLHAKYDIGNVGELVALLGPGK